MKALRKGALFIGYRNFSFIGRPNQRRKPQIGTTIFTRHSWEARGNFKEGHSLFWDPSLIREALPKRAPIKGYYSGLRGTKRFSGILLLGNYFLRLVWVFKGGVFGGNHLEFGLIFFTEGQKGQKGVLKGCVDTTGPF